jgi:hypothetical protein
MRRHLVLTALMLASCAAAASAQPPAPAAPKPPAAAAPPSPGGFGGQAPKPSAGARALREVFDFVLGSWEGEGSGQPGQGTGGFVFEMSLDGNLVLRRSHAEYPAAEGRPAVSHQDVMTVYPEGGQLRADYFDNEGHVIHYAVAFVHESATLTFVSAIAEGQPRYRLTYRPLAADRVEVSFDIAPPDKPTTFTTYVKGVSRRQLTK